MARAQEIRAQLARDRFEEAVEEHPFDSNVVMEPLQMPQPREPVARVRIT